MSTRFHEHVEVDVQTICLSVFPGVWWCLVSHPIPTMSSRNEGESAEIVMRVELFRAWWKFFSILTIGKRVCRPACLEVYKPEVAAQCLFSPSNKMLACHNPTLDALIIFCLRGVFTSATTSPIQECLQLPCHLRLQCFQVDGRLLRSISLWMVSAFRHHRVGN